MKKHLVFFLFLMIGTLPTVWGQSRPYLPKPGAKKKSSATSSPGRDAPKPPQAYGIIVIRKGSADEDGPPPIIMNKIKLEKPVLVYYEEPAPGKAVQQLIMSEENLPLLQTNDLEHLLMRRDVFIDGLGNMALPGSDAKKFRLLGTSSVAEDNRRPAGDGRCYFSRLKVPSSGFLYVLRESAEEYRHFVKGPQKKGAFLDFQVNGLPGIDSVRAVYTLRKTDSSERGAGTIR